MGDASEKIGAIRVVAVGALQTGLKPLGEEFTKQSGHPVDYTFTSPANLNSVISSGEFDVIVAAAPWIGELEEAGGVQAGSRVKAGRVGIGVAAREGASKPDVSTPDAFKKAILAARNIVYTDPAMPNGSGVVTMRILAAAGLVDVVKAKGKQSGRAGSVQYHRDHDAGLGDCRCRSCAISGLHPLRWRRDGKFRQQERGGGLFEIHCRQIVPGGLTAGVDGL
jgi:molybdate transport system substrate-binding protein